MTKLDERVKELAYAIKANNDLENGIHQVIIQIKLDILDIINGLIISGFKK